MRESPTPASSRASSRLAEAILHIAPGRRATAFQSVVSGRPSGDWENSATAAWLNTAFADYWSERFGSCVPTDRLQSVLEPPLEIGTVLLFNQLNYSRDAAEVKSALETIVEHLHRHLQKLQGESQLELFETRSVQGSDDANLEAARPVGGTVASLAELVARGYTFPTIYADPPWAYQNEASRAAAVNHYPTMSVAEICAEPVSQLAAKDAHLHLWATNGFLRDAFEVMDAWEFTFKSCLVWVKDEIGMGNYWRVSHEFLLLGVRGRLAFRDRTLPSWIRARRTTHSRKPGVVRALIERASPGPYLELYGREELPNSAWTVHGNQVEQRLF